MSSSTASRAFSVPPKQMVVGRYELLGEIGSGGMAVVYIGRIRGVGGFSRKVAVKQLHQHLLKEREFVEMFMDEALMASRVHHPNVVTTLDVLVDDDGQVSQVMEYVDGHSLSRIVNRLRAADELLPHDVVGALVVGMLDGLHAAHEARDDQGEPAHLVHRDVSPFNVLVSRDGVPLLHDFGVAKAAVRLSSTRDGRIKGRLNYMSPEQLLDGDNVDRRADIFAAGLVLFELLVSERARQGQNEGEIYKQVVDDAVPVPSSAAPDGVVLTPEIDAIVAKACAPDREDRYATAAEMSDAVADALGQARPRRVAEVMRQHIGAEMDRRSKILARIDSESSVLELDSRAWAALAPNHEHTQKSFGSLAGSVASGARRRQPTAAMLTTPPEAPRTRWQHRTSMMGIGLLIAVVLVLGYRECSDGTARSEQASLAQPVVTARASATAIHAPHRDSRQTKPPPEMLPEQAASTASAPSPVAAPPSTNATPDSTAAWPPTVPLGSPLPRASAAPSVSAKPTKPNVLDCSPPYYLTPEGTRRYKAECL